jgi:RNA polymerase-interacting CarD/CdnL/TRCF family regulator
MDTNSLYSINDWVVHTYYGVGQIRRIETRPIRGENTKCFKVNTGNCAYWFPISDKDNPRIRPVASQDILQKVIRNLRRKASTLDTDKKLWTNRIAEVQANGDVLSISNLIRDLSTQQVLRKITQTEEDALEHFKDRLLKEWATIVQEECEKLRIELQTHIEVSQAKVDVD